MPHINHLDRPIDSPTDLNYGSDAMAETFRSVGMEYIAVCPGTSLRGFHDSVVNHLGNREPQLVTALHEEAAVSIAHGYAKVTGKAMGVMVHANVGLLHASMSIYNAWCDRVPMVVIGGVGPVDATKRRPWIDWIHTSRDLGAIVRDFTKWDDQPASVAAATDSIQRAWTISHTQPPGPTFVNFDFELQEAEFSSSSRRPRSLNDGRPRVGPPEADVVREIATALAAASHPILLVGRVEADDEAWRKRVALAERFGLHVISDIKLRAGFPTDHPLHLPSGGLFPSERIQEELNRSDFILSLDWVDLGSITQRPAHAERKVVHVSADYVLHRGAHMDYQIRVDVDRHLHCSPVAMVDALLNEPGGSRAHRDLPAFPREHPATLSAGGEITMPLLGQTVKELLSGISSSLVRVPLRWQYEWIHATSALDYLGFDGGFGLGSGPGMLVGAALALQGTGRLPVAVLGDGDTLMGGTALWTAAHYRLPLLAIVANNASFYTDELHQERVAKARHRPTDNKWIGQAIVDPTPDLAAFARSLGLTAIGPVDHPHDLRRQLAEAIELAKNGQPVLVDVRVHGA